MRETDDRKRKRRKERWREKGRRNNQDRVKIKRGKRKSFRTRYDAMRKLKEEVEGKCKEWPW